MPADNLLTEGKPNQLIAKAGNVQGNLSVFALFLTAFPTASASCHSCKLNAKLDGKVLWLFL